MKVVAIAMQKGGVGKSTLTRSLAVAAAHAGLNAVALDMDLQQSVTQWSRRREEDRLPLPVRFVTELDLDPMLAKMASAGCDLVLIDTPPARSSEAPAAVEVADLVLIPCTPDIEAFEQLPKTVRLARTTGKDAFAVLNMATPNSGADVLAARAVFDRNAVAMAPVVLFRRKIHRDAAREGLAAGEFHADCKGSNEVARLWDWLSRELNLCSPATLQDGATAQ